MLVPIQNFPITATIVTTAGSVLCAADEAVEKAEELERVQQRVLVAIQYSRGAVITGDKLREMIDAYRASL